MDGDTLASRLDFSLLNVDPSSMPANHTLSRLYAYMFLLFSNYLKRCLYDGWLIILSLLSVMIYKYKYKYDEWY
jgi:hypothetical protein